MRVYQIKNYKAIEYYNIAWLYFLVSKYEEASKWVDKILNQPDVDSTYFYRCTRLFNMIIHFDLSDDLYLPYLTKSIQRALSKREQPLYKLELTLINFVNKITSLGMGKNRKIELSDKMKKELSITIKELYDSETLEHLAFTCWLESKIENRTVAEIYKEKFGERFG